ncbi:MAG: NAD-binding protein, partial [Nonomuraea sp.]|nr:NAD-binding protein [Nonomuraea sp.]
MNETQVVVVGGALTGLSAAVFLAHHGVRVTVVERHPDLLSHPRLRGITPRTVEVLSQVGLGQRIHDNTFLSGADGFVLVRSDTLAGDYEVVEETGDDAGDPRAFSPAPHALIDQDRLEVLLRERARELGAELRYGTAVTALDQDGDGVTVRLSDGSAIRAGYAIAADGSRSPIRGALGIECDGPGVLSDTVSAMVDADLRPAVRGRQVGLAYLGRPRPFTSMMPHDDTGVHWLFSTGYDAGQESPADFTPERVAAMIRAASGLDDVEVTLRPQIPGTDVYMLSFPIAAQVARAYRAGRVFLAGDAARSQPPTGGYGGSTGIQDAHNLAWKLAAVLHGQAGESLLDSYDTERRTYGRLSMDQAMARFAARVGGTAQELVDYTAVTMGFRYAVPGNTDTTPIPAVDLRGQLGTRAPHHVTAAGS